MAAGRKTAELASEPWQIGHGRTLCEEKVWPSLEFPANLCRAFHNVRLSITMIGEFEQVFTGRDLEPLPDVHEFKR
jgi:hypothetical protein